VVRGDTSGYAAEVIGQMMAATADDRTYAGLLGALRDDAAISVPLRARDRVIGAMTFVCAESSRIFGPGGLAVEEERRTVFREEVKAGEHNQAPRREDAPADVPWRRRVEPEPVLLFRFSALTFNSHRIHYDRTWATQTEGYPGLIVHGPLLGLLQIELARRSNPGKTPASFEFRALSPLFAGAPFTVAARREADGAQRLGGDDEQCERRRQVHRVGEEAHGAGEAVAAEPAQQLLGPVGEDDEAEREALDAELSFAQAYLIELDSVIRMYKALGGGWTQ